MNNNSNCIRTYHAPDHRWSIHHGKVEAVLPILGNSLNDGALLDPPYGIDFMGKDWDKAIPPVEVFKQILRSCKPGAPLLAFGHPKTFFRLMLNLAEAGWEIRETLAWIHCQGIPKTQDISKKIEETISARNKAKDWEGFGTALKPAWEPIILAMKPRVDTFAKNVLQHGCGGLNIDGCRIGTTGGTTRSNQAPYPRLPDGTEDRSNWGRSGHSVKQIDKGRWPSNVILDEEAAELLDEQSGIRASQFFYFPKASVKERAGNDHPTVKPLDLCEYLARLILPPARQTPRQLLVPYSGSGSEMIGAITAGWEQVTGIEMDDKYVKTAQRRLGSSKFQVSSLPKLKKLKMATKINKPIFDSSNFDYHPACKLFPGLPDEEFQALADDIKENGLIEPIVVHKDKILDGRNRFEACEAVGVDPVFVEWDGDDSPTQYVISKNLQRRHLSASQRAAIAYELLPLFESEAKERQRASKGRGVKVEKNCSHEIGKASKHAARLTNCSSTYVEQVKRAAINAPELLEEIRLGTLSVKNAADLSELPEDKRKQVVEKSRKPKAKVAKLVRQAEIDHREEQRKANQKEITLPASSDIQVWNGDCIKLMKGKIKANSVDVVATSIPYNVGVKYGTHDDNLDEEQYMDWLDEVFEAINTVLNEDGSFFLNVGSNAKKPWLAMRVMEVALARFKLQNSFVWAKSLTFKEQSIGQFRPVRSERHVTPCHEHIFYFTKRGDVKIDRLAIGVPFADKNSLHRFNVKEDCRCAGSVWVIPHDSTKSRRDRWSHPCPFPVELPERCIKLHGIKEGMTVLDPFNGVGSSTVAMALLGVHGIGIDIDKEYCQSAKTRLLAEQEKIERQRVGTIKNPNLGVRELKKELQIILEDGIDLGSGFSKQHVRDCFELYRKETGIAFENVFATLPKEFQDYYESLPATLAA